MRSGLVEQDDALWLLEQFQQRPAPERERWGLLLQNALHPENREAVGASSIACEADEQLKRILSPLFDPIELDSDEAKRLRKNYRWMNQKDEQEPEELTPKIPLSERIGKLLCEFEAGDLSAWWQLNYILMLESPTDSLRSELSSDLTVLPGWEDASDETQDSLLAAAERYVQETSPEPASWIDWGSSYTIFRPDLAGFRAFRLLIMVAPGRLETLPTEIWARWAPVIVAYPTLNPGPDDAPHQDLVALAYQHAPAEVIETLNLRMDAGNSHEHSSIERELWLVEHCWDSRLVEYLLNKARDPQLSPFVKGQLLTALSQHDVQPAVDMALSLIPTSFPIDEEQLERAVVAGALLLRQAAASSWAAVWSAMGADLPFAEGVLDRIIWNERYEESIPGTLTDDQLADLYIWLSRTYPQTEDPEGNGTVTYRIAVGQWRDSLLTPLRTRGTDAACAAIERIAEALPEQGWLQWTLLEAKSITRQRTWIPPQPAEILTLAQSAEQRLVQNADQLLDVVIESLKRLENRLQRAEPPMATFLWDKVEKNTFRPKLEESLSDYLKDHLDNDLRDRRIIFNREVSNRRGDETDIRVEAIPKGNQGQPFDPLSVIIEVKGCWNSKLKSAMETQLADRYLSNTKTSHGLYVVGWYNCDKWDQEDGKKRQAPKYDKVEAQQRLDGQATSLSKNGKCVRALVIDTSLPI